MNSNRRHRRVALAAVGAVALLAAPLTSGTAAAAVGVGSPRLIRPLTPLSSIDVAKTSRVAQTDPALLRLSGSALTPVMVKLDVDSLAVYQGDAAGTGATSPAVTGRKIDGRRAEVRGQDSRIAGVEGSFRQSLARIAPTATVGRSFRAVYGGVAARVPADRIAALAALPGVVAVQADTLNQPLATSDEASFIGAPTAYRALGSDRTAGKGVLIADLDTGVWPEHPSFAARPDLPKAPARPDGTALPCLFGSNPLIPASKPFICNNKLVSGQEFLQTYTAVTGDQPYKGTARDAEGHGTHTTSTAGGNPLAKAVLFGVDRGPIQGIAPGAQLAQYRVCGPGGCFGSDTTAAVEQAVLDGADVISFSISGGSTPFADPTELAFLDAYAAGIFVSASAGNAGPTAGTTDHLGPWVTTVAASSQSRAFVSTLTLQAGTATVAVQGASIMGGTGPHPVLRAESAAGYDALCSKPAKPGSFAGAIVICLRGVNGRVNKGQNVLAGGAAGMVLENSAVQDLETDNHFLPAVHVDAPQAATVDAFLAAHPTVQASFTAGIREYGHGDVMAAFSSRGPRGAYLKPDVTSTGVQVLAGNTPTPTPQEVAGTYFQAIAGTSMSAPHVSGAGALIKALHPTWTPGQIKSALATTATQSVVKQDGKTPADAFDDGSGRVDLTKAGNPGLTFDATAAQMLARGADPLRQIDLNLPSLYDAALPGRITTTRIAKNVTDRPLAVDVRASAGSGADIAVTPSHFTVAPGATRTLRIAIDAKAVPVDTTVFGQIDLSSGTAYRLHLPVVFTRAPGAVTATTTCAKATLAKGASTTCAVDVANTSLTDAGVSSHTGATGPLTLTGASGPASVEDGQATASKQLAGRQPDAPHLSGGASPFGYTDLAAMGVTATPIGDEAASNFSPPTAFVYHGRSYTSVGITSNGYAVVGGAGGADVTPLPQNLPDPAAPNDVLAPFWSDLDGTGDAGVRAAVLSAGPGRDYFVVQADEHIFGTAKKVTYQIWIGLNGTEDISFAYDASHPIVPDASAPYVVGVENAEGTAGQAYPGLPAGDVVVASTPAVPGGVLHYTVTIKATGPVGRTGDVITGVRAPTIVRGITNDVASIAVTR